MLGVSASSAMEVSSSHCLGEERMELEEKGLWVSGIHSANLDWAPVLESSRNRGHTEEPVVDS